VVKGERRTWIAGGDLKELASVGGAAAAAAYGDAVRRFCRGLDALPQVVVVAVDGAAIGGGAELALAGDLRLATAASTLEFRQLKVGLATGYGTTQRLVQLVGLGRAQDLLLRTRIVDAAEAVRLGLLTEAYATPAALWEAVERLVTDVAGLAPEAVRAQKAMLRAAATLHPGAAGAAELEAFAAAWGNPTHAAFLAAFAAPRGRGKSP
jgi:enoyl-CoA hydratase/carnithine racemase